MSTVVCIHCGSDRVRVKQRFDISFTYDCSFEEEFDVVPESCSGCLEACDGCFEPSNRVEVKDDDCQNHHVPKYEHTEFDDTHPIFTYDYDETDMEIVRSNHETHNVRFTTTCCGVERGHVRELVRLEDGPATFTDGSESQYSQTVQEVEIKLTADDEFQHGDKVIYENDKGGEHNEYNNTVWTVDYVDGVLVYMQENELDNDNRKCRLMKSRLRKIENHPALNAEPPSEMDSVLASLADLP